MSFSEIEAKREAVLFLFGCSEVNSTRIITSGKANQRAPKALFTCVAYTSGNYAEFELLDNLEFEKVKPNKITSFSGM